MVLLNFAHPLTPEQLTTVEALAGDHVEDVREFRTQFDPEQPFTEQARALVDRVGLTPVEWQTLPLLLNLPSLNSIAALLLAEVHGRTGHFPAVLRLKPVSDALAPRFEVAELLHLQGVRNSARRER
jgi:hypothetical protein